MTGKSPQITLSLRVAPELGAQVDAFAKAHGLANRTTALRVLLKRALAEDAHEAPAALNGAAAASIAAARSVPQQESFPPRVLARVEDLLQQHAAAHHAVARALLGNQLEAAPEADREAAREFLRSTFAPLLLQGEREDTL